MIGSGTGALDTPNATDFFQHLAGGPAIANFNSTVMGPANVANAAAISAMASSITAVNNLFQTAGVDFSTAAPNCLGTCMAFATSLKKLGQDTLTGAAPILKTMANDATQWGEAVKATMAEGFNDKILQTNGIPPVSGTSGEVAAIAAVLPYPRGNSLRPPGAGTGNP